MTSWSDVQRNSAPHAPDVELSLDPDGSSWAVLLADVPVGNLAGSSLEQWRRRTRDELGLVVDRPLVATGHQTLLWHPGILVKYLAVQAMVTGPDDIATANLIVDQHTSAFGAFDVPVRRNDGALDIRTIELTKAARLLPTIYSFTYNRYGEVSGSDEIRARFSAQVFREMAAELGAVHLSSAFLGLVESPIGPLLAEQVVSSCNLDTRVKRFHIGAKRLS